MMKTIDDIDLAELSEPSLPATTENMELFFSSAEQYLAGQWAKLLKQQTKTSPLWRHLAQQTRDDIAEIDTAVQMVSEGMDFRGYFGDYDVSHEAVRRQLLITAAHAARERS